jgi:hypothetical protein
VESSLKAMNAQAFGIGLQSPKRRACNTFEKLDATVFLRASDALHLACAVENQFAEIYSGDRILLQAAPYFGLKGITVYGDAESGSSPRKTVSE